MDISRIHTEFRPVIQNHFLFSLVVQTQSI